MSSQEEYNNKLKLYENDIKMQNKAISTIGYLRFLTFLIGFGFTIYTFIIKSYLISAGIFIVSLGIFIYLIINHNKEIEKRKYSLSIKDINERAIKRINGEWKQFEDDGSEYINDKHSFARDLDIFGKGSLFQLINSSRTYMGRHTLKSRLSSPLKTAAEIRKNQEAVSEIAKSLDFRQQFEAEGMLADDKYINPDNLYKWADLKNNKYTNIKFNLLVKILPIITLTVIILSLFKVINIRWASCMTLIQILILFYDIKERNLSLAGIHKFKNNIKVYYNMFNLLSKQDFKCEYLISLKNNLGKDDSSALFAIKKLYSVSDKVSERNNMFFIIMNILFLWDYQCMIELEAWKLKYGKDIKVWLETIGEIEALSSISNIAYDNKSYVMPKVSDEFKIKAQMLGHPLIGDKRVCNDIIIEKPKSILLITGSNMSGKSTFLRTIGINLVLCYIGSCVCAKKFECSIMDIYTCMRISDDLTNNISSFYAEILRIKMIVNNVKENKKVFFLLDELFKGTNSIDRHQGACALIKQLGNCGAAGLISTHDLELGDLANDYPKIKNYHFQEYYSNNELKFDYKIRDGVSTTRNAMYLIKLAGIDLN